MKRLVPLAFAVSLFGLTGCHIQNFSDDGECRFGCPGTACSSTIECAVSCSCQAGQCTAQNKCTNDAACGAGESCVSGYCHPSCNKNSQCHGGEYCLGGVCRGIPSTA